MAIAIAGFVAEELLIRGSGSGLIETLDDASRPGENALTGRSTRSPPKSAILDSATPSSHASLSPSE